MPLAVVLEVFPSRRPQSRCIGVLFGTRAFGFEESQIYDFGCENLPSCAIQHASSLQVDPELFVRGLAEEAGDGAVGAE